MTVAAPSFVHAPGSAEYDSGTKPHNAAADQRPAFVATPADAREVAAAIAFARERGLQVLPQATGHGAGGTLDADVLLLDLRGLDRVVIDAATRTASVGAGVPWAAVQAAAEPHGLLGPSGSAPSVGVAGYAFGGGIGWLVRPHGLGASALLEVDFVDGAGRLRTASDDAEDAADRDAMWAYRGGGGVGIAVEVRIELFPAPAPHGGYLLWHADALDRVVAAWADALPGLGADVATSIAQLQAPPGPPMPPELQGRGVVHLAIAASLGPEGAAALLAAVRGAAEPVVDTFGPIDAQRLGGIHLDPPPGSAALGVGLWLDDAAPAHAADLLRAADGSSPIVMTELRNVANLSVARPGAASAAAGPFVGHAVAALRPGIDPAAVQVALDAFRQRAEPVTVAPLASWMEGAGAVPAALPREVLARVAAVADAVDPDRTIRRSRVLR